MFNAKRLTSRAHKALQIALKRALASDRDSIAGEHLLAGLLEEGGGFAVALLVSLGVDIDEIRRRLSEVVPNSEPDQLVYRRLPLAKDLEHTLQFSADEANQLGADFVGTEHLLLGLLRIDNGMAGEILSDSGVQCEKVRTRLMEMSQAVEQASETAEPEGDEPEQAAETVSQPSELEGFTSKALEAVRNARAEARAAGRHHVGTDHLLLGVLSNEESAAVGALRKFTGDLDQLREELRKLSRLF